MDITKTRQQNYYCQNQQENRDALIFLQDAEDSHAMKKETQVLRQYKHGKFKKGERAMTTHELFQKHFGDVVGVGLMHPNMEAFFGELSEICKEENRQRLEKKKEKGKEKQQ
jgi:hypothetical protein